MKYNESFKSILQNFAMPVSCNQTVYLSGELTVGINTRAGARDGVGYIGNADFPTGPAVFPDSVWKISLPTQGPFFR